MTEYILARLVIEGGIMSVCACEAGLGHKDLHSALLLDENMEGWG